MSSENPPTQTRSKSKFKLTVTVGILVLALVIELQNTESVDTRILFFTISMPRAALLLFSVLAGFAAGYVTKAIYGKKKSRLKQSQSS